MEEDNIFNYTNTVDSMLVPLDDQSSQNLRVNKDHQWVSAISNRGPSIGGCG